MERKPHTAYELSLLTKFSGQIESMAAYADKLLVGTRQGHLFQYCVSTIDKKPHVELISYNKNFSKKPIQQIEVIPDHDIILKLSDNIVSMHELSSTSFTLIKTLNKTKGATLFALEIQKHKPLTGVSTSIVRLCVSVKRKLQLYYLKNREFLDLGSEITLRDIPKSIAWVKKSICVGFKNGYSLVENPGEDSVACKELCTTGKQVEPLITTIHVSGEDYFMVGRDTQSLRIAVEEKKELKIISGDILGSIKWAELPIKIGFDEPFLIGILPDTLQIKCWDDDNIEISGFEVKARDILTSDSGRVYLANQETVWIMKFVPVHQQIKLLLSDKHFGLALKLANVANDTPDEKKRNIHQIRRLFAYDLFHHKKYEKAMEQFLKLETDPYEVIKLFPEHIQDADSTENTSEDSDSVYPALIKYLTDVRAKTNLYKHSPQLKQIIDTTLLKCYIHTNDALIAPLIRRNCCNLEEAEKVLIKHQKWPELELLYNSKSLHSKALQLLRKQATQEDSPLRGPERTIRYLQNLGSENIEIILEFAKWVFESYPEESLNIFIDEIPELEELPRPKVLDFLLKTNNRSLIISYIEHAIYEWKDCTAMFHNALIHQYREQIMQLGQNNPLAKTYRDKLLKFLETSDSYTAGTIINSFPDDSMFEEKVLLNAKMNMHEIVLGIYMLVIGDYSRALEYANKVYTEKRDGYENVYLEILKILLHPPDSIPGINIDWTRNCNSDEDLNTALSLLDAHATRLDPSQALNYLPMDLPIYKIRDFLDSSLQDIVKKRSTSQQLRGLLNAIKLQVKKEKLELESKKITISETMVCPICEKRFANQSAFVRYPNDVVVHYSCQDRMKNQYGSSI